MLQATLVDTWASTAAGAFALSENNLYTTDAFRDYLNHLTDDGLMVFTRWGFEPPRESLRLLSLAIVALGEVGETDAWRHIVVLRDRAQNINAFGALDTVLIFRKPLGDADVAAVRSALSQTKLRALYLPGAVAIQRVWRAVEERRSKYLLAELSLQRHARGRRPAILSSTPCSRATF